MKLGTVPQAIASGAAVVLISACAAGIGVGAEPLEQAQAASYPRADYRPGTDLEPYCQWEYYKGKVNVWSPDATRYRVKFRKRHGYKIVTNTSGTFKAKARGFAEDDVRKVSCKVGKWRVAEPA